MASSISRKQDEYHGSGRNHPVDAGDLLAVIRDQHLDNEAFVRRHLEECEQCRQTYARLVHTSSTLDALEKMARYQRYPELSSIQMLVKARQSASRQRSSSYRLPMRGVSLPVAVILIIMTIAIVIAMSLVQIGKLPSPWRLPGGGSLLTSNPAYITEVKEHLPSPTVKPTRITTNAPGVTVTISPGVTVTLSPTGTAQAGPYLEACTTTATDKHNQVTAICGYHFPPGDKVTLYVSVDPSAKEWDRLNWRVSVDGSGNFMYNWRSYLCDYESVTIFAVDRTSNSPIVVEIDNVPPPGCPVPSPAPTPTSMPTAGSGH